MEATDLVPWHAVFPGVIFLDLMQEMKAFWLPSKTPEAQQKAEKPDMDTICPATGKKLRLKDIITVNFTRVPEGEEGFAMDPVTKDTFSNAHKLAVLKPTGEILWPASEISNRAVDWVCWLVSV